MFKKEAARWNLGFSKMLSKNRSHSCARCIYFNSERLFRISVFKYGSRWEYLFEALKGVICSVGPHDCLDPSLTDDGSRHQAEVFDEMVIKICKAQKSLGFFDCVRHWPLSHSTHFLLIHSDSISTYNISKKGYCVHVKLTFFSFNVQLVVSEALVKHGVCRILWRENKSEYHLCRW